MYKMFQSEELECKIQDSKLNHDKTFKNIIFSILYMLCIVTYGIGLFFLSCIFMTRDNKANIQTPFIITAIFGGWINFIITLRCLFIFINKIE